MDISVIVPVYNEAPNLETLVNRLLCALRPLKRPFEIILVDDGSTDESYEIFKKIKAVTPELKVVIFRRNFGQSAAMTAGFDHANGKIIVSMDGDLQNDPQDIPRLIDRLEEGYDMVSGWRRDRKDPFISRKLPSLIANRLISRSTGVHLHDYGCSLKAYSRDVAKNLLLYGELHRFIPVLAHFYGARITEEVVTHHPRLKGKSKYGIGRTYRVILDLMLMLFFLKFATRPLQFFGIGGGALFLSGLMTGGYLTFIKFFLRQDIGHRPLLILSAILIIAGLILGAIGLLAELVIRTYYESSGKRIYSVREIIE
ncbi:MAG: glycosyltransferase family 2 protein [Dissulfurimicrobium sp.]|uniref:glycosyltransferase family 2 protein n=1 Tax=Dissulfurimicrobium sp. TaxID=2022436 RepID=UPI00404B0682